MCRTITALIIPRPILHSFFQSEREKEPIGLEKASALFHDAVTYYAVRAHSYRHTCIRRKNQGQKTELVVEDNVVQERGANSNKVVNVEEAKEYMKEHVDPIISELLTDIVVDRPENVLKYMLEWTRKKRESDPK